MSSIGRVVGFPYLLVQSNDRNMTYQLDELAQTESYKDYRRYIIRRRSVNQSADIGFDQIMMQAIFGVISICCTS